MWIIKKIEEMDSDCEERYPGEPSMLLLTLESEEGEELQLEVSENWMKAQELAEGEEWLEDFDDENAESQNAVSQSE